MLRCYWFSALAIGVLLLAGCRTAPSRHSDHSSTEPVESSEQNDKLTEAHAHYAAGFIHDINEEPEAALEEYRLAAQCDPANEDLALDLSRRYLQAKQPEKALEVLNRTAAMPDASGRIFARMGFIYSQLGKYDQAVAANRKAVQKAPESLQGYQNLFLNYSQNKRPQEALKVLEDAGKQARLDVEGLMNLAELYANFALQYPAQRTNAYAKGLGLLDKAYKMDPPNPTLRLRLADAYNALGNSARASELYLDLLKKLPDLAWIRERIHEKLTNIYIREEDRKRAVGQLEAIVKENPTNPQAYYYLGAIASEEKRNEAAADYFNKTILLSPDFEQAYYDLAISQLNLNHTNEALATLEKAHKKFPQSFVSEFLTGMAYSRQKSYPEAIKHYTSAEVIAQATNPKRLTGNFYFQFGAACERNKDYEQAAKCFEKALELEPNFSEAQNYLGYMWAEQGTHLDRARELIEKAVKAEPKNAAYLDSLGWVLFQLHQPKQALEYALQAAAFSEEPDPTLYDHLGDIYAALNQHEKAREAWQKSIALEPSETVQQKLAAPEGPK